MNKKPDYALVWVFIKNFSFTIVKLDSFTLMVTFKIFKYFKIFHLKTPKLIRKYIIRFGYYYRYIKTFFKYAFNFKPIYILRTEYDYVDHCSTSYPQMFKNGFMFWYNYHKDSLKDQDIDVGYNLYVDFISKDEYEHSGTSSRDYAMEAFENGHPSTIRR